MATYQSVKQKLIDRITTLAGSATTLSEVNFLTKTLDQVGENPRYMNTERHNKNVLREPQASEVTASAAANGTIANITPLTGGVHREYEATATGDMQDGVYEIQYKSKKEEINFENVPAKMARPQFGIWSQQHEEGGGLTTYDEGMRPYDRRWFKGSGTNWCYSALDGGASHGNYSSRQRARFAGSNHCYLNTHYCAGSSNTSASHEYHYPSRTGMVGELGHFRIRSGPGSIIQMRMYDTGPQFKWENLEVGTCQLDHKQSYLALTGKTLHLRERWMCGRRTPWHVSSSRGQQMRETHSSPSEMEYGMGWDVGGNQLLSFMGAFGSVTSHKERQQVAVLHQVTTGQQDYIIKVWHHVDRIRRLTLLEDVLKDEHCSYIKFTYTTGWKNGSTEGQQCQKLTMTDDGTIFMTNMALNESFYLGSIKKDWASATDGEVCELVITDPGTGYNPSSPPTITIASPNDGGGTQATGTITVGSDGKCNGYTITTAGSKYAMTGTGITHLYDTTPTPSTAWQADQTHTAQTTSTTSGNGAGAEFTITTDSSGNPTFAITTPGTGYKIDDTLTFTDPGNTTNTCVITVLGVTEGEIHPKVTIASHNGGSGLKVTANIKVGGTNNLFEHKSALPTSGTTYGRENGYHGQMIVMNRDKSASWHFCPHYGWGTGMQSFIIDRATNSYQAGRADSSTDYGSQVVAHDKDGFAVLFSGDWNGNTNAGRKLYIYYKSAIGTVDAGQQAQNLWLNSDVGSKTDVFSNTTNFPIAIPVF